MLSWQNTGAKITQSGFTEIGCKVVNAGSPEERAQFLADLYKHPLEGAVEKRFWFNLRHLAQTPRTEWDMA